MRIQQSSENEGGKIACKVGEYAWVGEKKKGQNGKNRGAGGVGFLVKEYLCDIIEAIKDTKFDEVANNAEQFSELLEIIGTMKNDLKYIPGKYCLPSDNVQGVIHSK